MMNSSSNSSGNHPMEGVNNTSNSSGSGGEVLGGGDTNMKSADNCNDDTAQNFRQSSKSEMMREDSNNNCSGKFDTIQDESSCNESDSSGDDEDDIPEIVDLQKALEYLVSERDIEKIYNGIISTSHSTNATAQSDKENNKDNDDEQLHMIPSLVNRILMENFSQEPLTTNQQQQNQNDTSCAQKDISRKQRHKLTQLLLAVIVEFAEPYFVRVAQYKDQERARKIQQKKQKKEMKEADEKKRSATQPKEDTSDQSLEFDERAVSWATSCIKQLIEYPGPAEVSIPASLDSLFGDNNINSDENDQKQMSLEDHHIPELDALLAATGKHDAMEMEQDFQRAILQGLQSRLLHMGIE